MKAPYFIRRPASAGLLVLLLLTVAFRAEASALERIRAAGAITVCADPDTLPMSSASLSPPGYDIEIARDIAASLGVKLQYLWFATEHMNKVFRQLYDQKCDFVVGIPTDERLEGAGPQLSLSEAYMTAGFVTIVGKGVQANRLEDLKGHRIGVEMHTVPDFVIFNLGYDRSLYARQTEVFEAVAKGEVFAGVMTGPLAGWLAKQRPEAEVRVLPDLRSEFAFPMAIAVSKEDTDLLAAINAEIERIIHSGKRDQILERYGFPTMKAAATSTGRLAALARLGADMTRNSAWQRSPFLKVVGGSRPAAPTADDNQPTPDPAEAGAAAAQTTALQPPERPLEPDDQHESGFNLYHRACAKCHGRNVISGGIFPDLRRFQGNDDEFLTTVREGRTGTVMPSWKNFFSNAEIVRIREYIKTIPPPTD